MTHQSLAPDPALNAARRVDGERLWQRLVEMASIGAIPGGGVCRQALTPEDIVARERLIGWATQRGYQIAVDPIANLFIRRPGTDPDAPPVLVGSHMDSQPQGGRFDGIYGVLAALAALAALDAAGVRTRHPVELVAWTNEEGGRFAPGAMGSMTFAGQCRLEDCLDVTDSAGVRFGDVLRETLNATPDAGRRPLGFPVAGYLEAHIEQGPRLEAENKTIGIVTGVQGARWFQVTVSGETGHAGTVPRRLRRDALQAVLDMIQALNGLMYDPSDTVRFTVGRLTVSPNSPNAIPERVRFSIDFRHPDARLLAAKGEAVETVVRGAAGDCRVEIQETFHHAPCEFHPGVVAALESATRRLNLPFLRLPSGAFHDALFLNDRCPTGMVFVPCEKGISHDVRENATPEDLCAGSRVLTATLATLADKPPEHEET